MNERQNRNNQRDRQERNGNERNGEERNIRSQRGGRYNRPRDYEDQDGDQQGNQQGGYQGNYRGNQQGNQREARGPREPKEVHVENPQKDFKFINKEDIDEDFKIPAIPAQPKLVTPEEKEKKQGVLEEEIRKLENQKGNIIGQINECRRKIKKHRKPDAVQHAEERKRKLLDGKKKLQLDVNSLNQEKKDALKTLQGSEAASARGRGAMRLPQDEEELDFLIQGWNEQFETTSLKKEHEEEVFKKLLDLEKMRPNLTDVNNFNKELTATKKKLTLLKERLRETYEHITSINIEVEEHDQTINAWLDEQQALHQADNVEIGRLEQTLERVKESIRAKRDEKNECVAEFKRNKKLMDYWKEVRDNIKQAERFKEQLLRAKERNVVKEKEQKERAAREMNAHEVRIAQARQAIVMLAEIKAQAGKKIVLKLEAIQLFSKLELDQPKNKDDVQVLIEKLNTIIEHETQENDKIN